MNFRMHVSFRIYSQREAAGNTTLTIDLDVGSFRASCKAGFVAMDYRWPTDKPRKRFEMSRKPGECSWVLHGPRCFFRWCNDAASAYWDGGIGSLRWDASVRWAAHHRVPAPVSP